MPPRGLVAGPKKQLFHENYLTTDFLLRRCSRTCLFNFQVSSLSFLMDFLYSCICHSTIEELILDGSKVLEHNEWVPPGLNCLFILTNTIISSNPDVISDMSVIGQNK